MEYGFDGRILRNRSGKRLAEVDRNYVRNDTGTRIGEIDRNYIKDSKGGRIADFDDESIKDSSGRRIATIKDVQKVIRGPGGISLVALWLLVVRYPANNESLELTAEAQIRSAQRGIYTVLTENPQPVIA